MTGINLPGSNVFWIIPIAPALRARSTCWPGSAAVTKMTGMSVMPTVRRSQSAIRKPSQETPPPWPTSGGKWMSSRMRSGCPGAGR